jgi:hypothetical protein
MEDLELTGAILSALAFIVGVVIGRNIEGDRWRRPKKPSVSDEWVVHFGGRAFGVRELSPPSGLQSE